MVLSVREVLDGLATGEISLDAAVADFASRTWPAPKRASDAQVWGAADDEGSPVDGWETVDADSRLTSAQYGALAAAYAKAIETGNAANSAP